MQEGSTQRDQYRAGHQGIRTPVVQDKPPPRPGAPSVLGLNRRPRTIPLPSENRDGPPTNSRTPSYVPKPSRGGLGPPTEPPIIPGSGSSVPRPSRGPRRRNVEERPALPPPQPVLVPGAHDLWATSDNFQPWYTSPPSAPQRSQSFMQRIRKMRDSPNTLVQPYPIDGTYLRPDVGDGGNESIPFGLPPPVGTPPYIDRRARSEDHGSRDFPGMRRGAFEPGMYGVEAAPQRSILRSFKDTVKGILSREKSREGSSGLGANRTLRPGPAPPFYGPDLWDGPYPPLPEMLPQPRPYLGSTSTNSEESTGPDHYPWAPVMLPPLLHRSRSLSESTTSFEQISISESQDPVVAWLTDSRAPVVIQHGPGDTELVSSGAVFSDSRIDVARRTMEAHPTVVIQPPDDGVYIGPESGPPTIVIQPPPAGVPGFHRSDQDLSASSPLASAGARAQYSTRHAPRPQTRDPDRSISQPSRTRPPLPLIPSAQAEDIGGNGVSFRPVPAFTDGHSYNRPGVAPRKINNNGADSLRDLLNAIPANPQSDEAQTWIDELDKVLDGLAPGSETYSHVLRKIRGLCRHSSCLPQSCRLKGEIQLKHPDAVSKSNLSDVYIGLRAGKQVALKALRMHVDDRAKVEKAFAAEVVVWKRLSHVNIVPFMGVSDIFPACLVSLWMVNGSIRSYLEAHPTRRRAPWLLDICNGLKYMHSLGLVHGDLKGVNVLVNKDLRACLTDFGLTALTYHTDTSTATSTSPGTLRWMAPELISAKASEGTNYLTTSADMYSLAMTWWEMFALKPPFHEYLNAWAAITPIVKGERPGRPETSDPDGVSDAVWDIMEMCWTPEPMTRPGISYVASRLRKHLQTSLAGTAY